MRGFTILYVRKYSEVYIGEYIHHSNISQAVQDWLSKNNKIIISLEIISQATYDYITPPLFIYFDMIV